MSKPCADALNHVSCNFAWLTSIVWRSNSIAPALLTAAAAAFLPVHRRCPGWNPTRKLRNDLPCHIQHKLQRLERFGPRISHEARRALLCSSSLARHPSEALTLIATEGYPKRVSVTCNVMVCSVATDHGLYVGKASFRPEPVEQHQLVRPRMFLVCPYHQILRKHQNYALPGTLRCTERVCCSQRSRQ